MTRRTRRRPRAAVTVSAALAAAVALVRLSDAFFLPRVPQHAYHTHTTTSCPLAARRRKKRDADDNDLNRWYDTVDADATPDDVFWEEMERQRQLTEISEAQPQPVAAATTTTTSTTTLPQQTSPLPSPQQPKDAKSTDATLAEYAAYMVDDNWLDEELAVFMGEDIQDLDVEEQDRHIDREFEAMQRDDESDNAWMTSDEPWDHWGEHEDPETRDILKVDPNKASEFLFQDTDDDGEEAARLEREHLERISRLQIKSLRLERARESPKAAAFFGRAPNEREGFDRLWVSAIDNVCFKNLVGVLRDYGVEFADNFGDFKDSCVEDGLFTIEEVASYKARKVFEVTGLPCIASRTSFEIEPVATGLQNPGGGRAVPNANPRITSGYRFNDVGNHVDYVIDALKPVSEPTRVTRFRTCLCYYDGEMEVFDYGVLDCDLHFANSVRTFIPVAAAVNEMCKTLQLTFGLEYQKWLKKRVMESLHGYGEASSKLRDRVLKEAKVLPNDIIDVSAFMDSQIDVNLMDECAKELANKFVDLKPSKILTVATTGLVLALPMAKYLQVPVVYARKERNIVMSNTYKAEYTSKTVGKNRNLFVSKSHLDAQDRVLVVDDFLSSGASQEALMQIISDSGATAVGAGVLLEKAYDAGRQALSGFNIPIHSLCRVVSVKNGVIQLQEEEGYDRM